MGDDGACPYFYPIGNGGEHILLHFSHKSGGKYLIGNYDTQRQKFIVTDGGNFNHGPAKGGGIHAPSACPDGKGGIVVLFNTNPGFPRKDDFSEMMTLPRLLTWEEGAHRRPSLGRRGIACAAITFGWNISPCPPIRKPYWTE